MWIKWSTSFHFLYDFIREATKLQKWKRRNIELIEWICCSSCSFSSPGKTAGQRPGNADNYFYEALLEECFHFHYTAEEVVQKGKWYLQDNCDANIHFTLFTFGKVTANKWQQSNIDSKKEFSLFFSEWNINDNTFCHFRHLHLNCISAF